MMFMTGKRDMEIVRHIRRYCGEIEETIAFFGNDRVVFLANAIYRNSAATPIEQIGESIAILG